MVRAFAFRVTGAIPVRKSARKATMVSTVNNDVTVKTMQNAHHRLANVSVHRDGRISNVIDHAMPITMGRIV